MVISTSSREPKVNTKLSSKKSEQLIRKIIINSCDNFIFTDKSVEVTFSICKNLIVNHIKDMDLLPLDFFVDKIRMNYH